MAYFLNNQNSTFDCDACKKPRLLHSNKNLTQNKMNPKFISNFSGSFRIHAGQYLQDNSEVGMNQPETHMWLAKCLSERISHVYQKSSSIATLWIFITIRRTEMSSPKCKVKCQNESNVFRRKIKPVVESDLKNKDYHMTFKNVDWIFV